MTFWIGGALTVSRESDGAPAPPASPDFSPADFSAADFATVARTVVPVGHAGGDVGPANEQGVGIRSDRGVEPSQSWPTPRVGSIVTELQGRRLTQALRDVLEVGSYLGWTGPGNRPRWAGRISSVDERPDSSVTVYQVEAEDVIAQLSGDVEVPRVPLQRVDQAIAAVATAQGIPESMLVLDTARGSVRNFGTDVSVVGTDQVSAEAQLYASPAGRDIAAGASYTYVFNAPARIAAIVTPVAGTHFSVSSGSVTVTTSFSGATGRVTFTAGAADARIANLSVFGQTVSSTAQIGAPAPGMNLILQAFAIEGQGALLYVDRAGRLVFRRRGTLQTALRSVNSQATIRSIPTVAAGEILTAEVPTHNSGADRVINRASMTVITRSQSEVQLLHSAPAGIDIPAGSSHTVRFTAGARITALQTPVAGTGFSVSAGRVTVATSFSGATGRVTFTAGPTNARIANLVVYGQLEVIGETTVWDNVGATESIRQYGERLPPPEWEPWPEISVGEAQTLCDALVYEHQAAKRLLTVAFNNLNHASQTAGDTLEIGDRISADLQTDILTDRSDYHVEGVLQRKDDPRIQQTTLQAAQVGPGAVGASSAWGSAIWGSSSWGS